MNTHEMIQMIAGLFAVLAVLLIALFLLKRMKLVSFNKTNVVKLIGGINLGPREKLILVECGNQQILVGVTNQSITPIHVLNEPLTESVTSEKGASFLTVLQNKMKREKT